MGMEEQIAQAIFNRSHHPDDPLDLPDSQVNALAAAVMPLVKRAQAEALRDLGQRYWDHQGQNEVTEAAFLAAEKIEKEAGA